MRELKPQENCPSPYDLKVEKPATAPENSTLSALKMSALLDRRLVSALILLNEIKMK